MIDSAQTILTAAATLTGIYVALSGLSAWRGELYGRRDIELCQKVIELFYEAEQKVSLLRSPFSYQGEGKRQKLAGESERDANFKDNAFVPLARLNDQATFWNEFFSFKFRMRALFGDRAKEAFDTVDECLRHFRAAAATRYGTIQGDRYNVDTATLRKFEETIWMIDDTDGISSKMKTAISSMESICIPVVRQKQPWLARMFARLQR